MCPWGAGEAMLVLSWLPSPLYSVQDLSPYDVAIYIQHGSSQVKLWKRSRHSPKFVSWVTPNLVTLTVKINSHSLSLFYVFLVGK